MHSAPDQTAAHAVDVCLVLMPYAEVKRPSIALSILKAALAKQGIRAGVVYGNLAFAEEIGVYAHDIVGNTRRHSLAGEWTFAGAAFPGFEPEHDAYFEHVTRGLRDLLLLVRQHRGRGAIEGILKAIRAQAPGFVDRLARRILASGPRVVGVSSMFQQHCASLALLRRVKELQPEVVTVIGGANCEASMGVVTHRECPWVDYVVSGEGDVVFPALCKALLAAPDCAAGHGSLPSVIGPRDRAAGSAGYQRLLVNPPRAILDDLDASPTPDYDDYFRTLRGSELDLQINPGLLLETSRGCWWGKVRHCTFCGMNGASIGYRAKSPERVLSELDDLAQRYDHRTFQVVDSVLHMPYFETLIPSLARLGRYVLFYETRPNLRRSHVEQLAAAGIRWLQPGIESLDDGILQAIAKGTSVHQNLQLLKWARDNGVYALWVLLYDIPGESDDAYHEMAELIPLISHLQPPGGLSFIEYTRFSPYHSRPAEFGLRLSPDRSYAGVYPWSADALNDFAYFFDDYTSERDQLGNVDSEIQRSGLRRIHAAVADWQRDWRGWMTAGAATGELPKLVRRTVNGGLLLEDSRRCRVAGEFLLRGIEKEIYEICDRATTRANIQRRLAECGLSCSEVEVTASLERLTSDKLLLHRDRRYFSLALNSPLVDLPTIADYPGGRIRSVEEARAAELVRGAKCSDL